MQRADLPPRVRAALNGLLETTGMHFSAALRQTLDEFEQALFKLAERAASNAQQQAHFEALREIRLRRADITPRFLRHAESPLARIRDGARVAPAPLTAATLELVDPSVLEEDLALREIAGKAEIRSSQALHALAHRLGVLAAAPAWAHETLPLGPLQLIAALRHALGALELGVEHRVLAYRQFDRVAMQSIGDYYGTLNAQLAAQRILPNLHWSAARPRGDATQRPGPAPTTAAVTSMHESDDTGTVQLFRSLRDLLGTRRRRDEDRFAIPATAAHASPADLQSLLGLLQREPDPDAPLGDAVSDSTRFKRELLDRLRRAGPHGSTLRLRDEDADTIDLVGLLFDYLGANLRADSGARALLQRLHLPMLRVALGDHSFFTRRSHPARELLKTIAETGARWIDETDADPDLSAKMRLVVNGVGAGFDGDPVVFEHLLTDLGRYMQLLARRAEIVERRHVDAAKGRDRLAVARATARGAIAQTLQQGAPSAAVRALLEQAWTDALALSVLRQGRDSDEFRRRLGVAVTLSRHDATTSIDTELRRELEAGLRQVGLHEDDIAELLTSLRSAAASARGGHESDRAGDTAPVGTTGFGDPLAAAATARAATKPEPIPLNAAESAMLERLRGLPFGTWFVFRLNQQGASVRRKLAWYSTVTRRCLFVNQRGMRGDERTLDQLARDMVRGQAEIEAAPQTSLIDRAWKAILETLSGQEAT